MALAKPQASRLMTLQQASNESGLPYTTLIDMTRRGLLPRVQIGDSRRVWIERAALERLISNSTAAAE